VRFGAIQEVVVTVTSCSATGVASGSSAEPLDLRLPATMVQEVTAQERTAVWKERRYGKD